MVKALKIYGAKDGQLEAVGWGEGAGGPAATTNRLGAEPPADIVYPKK